MEEFGKEQRLRFLVDPAYVAPYKIQVSIGHTRKRDSITCTVHVWESGKKLHGDGDALMVECKTLGNGKLARGLGCGKFLSMDLVKWILPEESKIDKKLPLEAQAYMEIVCPFCGLRACTKELATETDYVNVHPKKVAQYVASVWRTLRWGDTGGADIYLVHYRKKLIEDAVKGGDTTMLLGPEQSVEHAIFPFKNIADNIENGRSLEDVITEFIIQ